MYYLSASKNQIVILFFKAKDGEIGILAQKQSGAALQAFNSGT